MKLEGKLSRSGGLTVSMDLVGRYEADRDSVRADELSGDCQGVTHFVYGVAVGAFDFYANAHADVGGGVGVGGAGAGARSKAERDNLSRDGEPEACAKASPDDKSPPAQCGALIRVEVVPLGDAKKLAPSCPDGTKWDGSKCAASVDTSCARGMHFVAGQGCVADVVAAPAPAPAPSPAPAAASGGMVRIAAGSFLMGDDKHSERVGAFEMDVTEVTVAAYTACVNAGRCTPANTGNDFCNWGKSDRANHPINCVDWDQATAYCAWAGKRLPSEQEWEYAARGTDGRTYPWGETTPGSQLCWDGEGSDLGKGNRQSTCPVGSYPRGDSPFGLHDMAGNVWEWTSSGEGAARVFRGGGWSFDISSLVRATNRVRGTPTDRSLHVGFRCAR